MSKYFPQNQLENKAETTFTGSSVIYDSEASPLHADTASLSLLFFLFNLPLVVSEYS